jgi:hypothetical protein
MGNENTDVKVLVQRVLRERTRWVCRRRQYVLAATDNDNVWSMASAGAFSMVSMNGSITNCLKSSCQFFSTMP